MDQESNAGDNQQEQGGKRINQERKRNTEFTDMDKLEQGNDHWLKILFLYFKENQQAHHKGSQDHTAPDQARKGF